MRYITLIIIVLTMTTTWAVTIYTTDFIADASRTGYVSFNGLSTSVGVNSYSEGGILVQQINGQTEMGICNSLPYYGSGMSWYPNSGDYGYTKITLVSGADFASIGFHIGTGGGGCTYGLYEVWNNGVKILSGSFTSDNTAANGYLGFSGGGFDTILIRNRASTSNTMTDGTFNTLSLDNIEIIGTSVPEPTSILLLTLAIFGAFCSRKN